MPLAAYYTHTNSEIAGIAIVVVFAALMWVWARRDPVKRTARPRYTLVRVRSLAEGDCVDLEGDHYADPTHNTDANTAFEYYVVGEVERETPDCYVVHFDNGSFGFPPEHKLKVRRDR